MPEQSLRGCSGLHRAVPGKKPLESCPIAAGLWQLSPMKGVCLRHCRTPPGSYPNFSTGAATRHGMAIVGRKAPQGWHSCDLACPSARGREPPVGNNRISGGNDGGDIMKAMIAAVAIALSLAFATNSAYAGRVANTAIGTLAGLVVFGPVGAVAGAAVGYSAGHGIARSWGLSRPAHTPPRKVQRKDERTVSSVPVPKTKPSDSRPVERAY
jgi:hypothetical protein